MAHPSMNEDDPKYDEDKGQRTTEDGARAPNMSPGAAEQTRRAQERGPVEPAHPASPHRPQD